MHLSLRNRTIVSIAIIEAALLIVLIFTAVNFMRDTLNDDLAKRSSTVAKLFATTTKGAVLTYDLASLETYCNELMENPDIAYVRIVNSANQVLAQAGSPSVLARQFIQDVKVDNVTDGIFDNFVNITESEHIYGRVELGIDITSIEQSITSIQRWISGIGLVEMVLVALFSFVLGNYLTSQLRGLRSAARSISKDVKSGSFSHNQLPVKGQDELTEVTQAFNTLITTLETEHARKELYQKDLEILNSTLEEKVYLRTTLLNQRNNQLEEKNQELIATQKQLVQAEKMASIGQLAAGVAHEINNPIGFVKSNLNSLRDYILVYQQLASQLLLVFPNGASQPKDSEQQKLVEILQNEDLEFINDDIKDLLTESLDGLERVTTIVKGLKQCSRVDLEEKHWCDLNECIDSTLNMVHNELKYHCTIEKTLSPLPKIWMNYGKISQVLTNLFINAGQAIQENGQISITTEHNQDTVVISVKDNGSGIAQEHLNKLFDPFFTTKAVGIGTGLGLSISYGIIQEHNGEITASSELNQGSCFKITLPIGNAPAPIED